MLQQPFCLPHPVESATGRKPEEESAVKSDRIWSRKMMVEEKKDNNSSQRTHVHTYTLTGPREMKTKGTNKLNYSLQAEQRSALSNTERVED